MKAYEALNESGIYESTPASTVVFTLATIHISLVPRSLYNTFQTPRSQRFMNKQKKKKERKKEKTTPSCRYFRCNFSIYKDRMVSLIVRIGCAAIRVNCAFRVSLNLSENSRQGSLKTTDVKCSRYKSLSREHCIVPTVYIQRLVGWRMRGIIVRN